MQTEVDYSVASRDASLHLGATRSQEAWSFGASLGYSNRSLWSASVNLRLGLALEPRGRRFFAKAQGATNSGAVSMQAFLDALPPGSYRLELAPPRSRVPSR